MPFLINSVTDSHGKLIPERAETQDTKLTFSVETSQASQTFTVRNSKNVLVSSKSGPDKQGTVDVDLGGRPKGEYAFNAASVPDTEFSKSYRIYLV